MTTTEGRPLPEWIGNPEAAEAWHRCGGGLDVKLPNDMPDDCFAADVFRLLAAGATLSELEVIAAAWGAPSGEWAEAFAWMGRRAAATSALDLRHQGVPTPGVTPEEARGVLDERWPQCGALTRRERPCVRQVLPGFPCWQHEAVA